MRETPEEFIARKRREFEADKKPRKFRDIGREGHNLWLREGWSFMIQSTLREKIFMMERFRLVEQTGVVAHPLNVD